MRYRIQYRERVAPDEVKNLTPRWDLLISAYNQSSRVTDVFRTLPASDRLWAIQDEYGFDDGELPDGDVVCPPFSSEAGFVRGLVDHVGNLSGRRVCVDITGFMRHTLLALLRELVQGLGEPFWLLYSDPSHYKRGERTEFSAAIGEVRQVDGFHGSHDPSGGHRDHLILGTGYDGPAMRATAENKRQASRTDVLGLPSLQPSMYQENVLSVAEIGVGPGGRNRAHVLFAAANDPFATAEALHQHVHAQQLFGGNLYLAPTGPKPQVVGFGLFYLAECRDEQASIILPFPTHYGRETSVGHARTWLYEISPSFVLSER